MCFSCSSGNNDNNQSAVKEENTSNIADTVIKKQEKQIVSSEPDLKSKSTPIKIITDKVSNNTELISDNKISAVSIPSIFTTKPETFKIDQKKDTVLSFSKGTKLYLPANSLQFADGRSANGQVDISVTECYSNADFITNDLTTTSGQHILESAGMLNISVTSNGQPLTIKKGGNYALYFPKKEQKERMELFYGNKMGNGVINWTTAMDTEIQDSKPVKDTSAFDSSYWTHSIHIMGYTSSINSKNVGWKIKNSGQVIFNYFDEKFKTTKMNEKEFCNNKYDIHIEFHVDSTGKIRDAEYIRKSSLKSSNKYYKIFRDFLYSMDALDTGSMGEYSNNQTYSLHFSSYEEFDKERYSLDFKKKYRSFTNQAITKIPEADLNYYVVSATKFGWINCDRFWNMPDEKINFVVNTPSPADTKIFITFKNVKSIMQGNLENNKQAFNNIPVNQPIRIIGIRQVNGKPTMAVAETTIKKDGYELSGFKDFSLDELERELNNLN